MSVKLAPAVKATAGEGVKLITFLARLATHSETRRSAISLVDQALVSGASFLTTVILGRLCQAEEIALYYLALTIYWFIQDIIWELVSAPFEVMNHRRAGRKLATYTGSTFAHQILLTVLLTMGMVGYLWILNLTGASHPLLNTTAVLTAALPLMLLREFIRQLCFGLLKSHIALAVDATVVAIQLGGLALFAYTGMLTAASVYSVLGVSSGVAALIWLLVRTERMQFRPRRVIRDWKANWLFSRWAVISMLMGRATAYLMPWIMLWAHDASMTALLGMCTTLIGLPSVVVLAICNCFRPRLFREYATGGLPALKRSLAITSIALSIAPLAFLFAVCLLGDRVGTLVYGPSCAGCGAVLAILTIGRLAGALGVAFGAGLWSLNRPQDNFMPNAWDMALTLAGAALLVPAFGVIGAASAIALGNLAGVVTRWNNLRPCLWDTNLLVPGAPAASSGTAPVHGEPHA